MRFLVEVISSFRHCFAILWFFLAIGFFRRIFIPCLRSLPRPVMVFGAQRFVKIMIWWETYWTEYYLYNGRSYWENVKLIKSNGLCPSTTLSNYEYFFARPELC